MAEIQLTEELKKTWAPILEAEGVDPIKDPYIKNVTTRLLQQTVNEAGVVAPTQQTGSADNWDPVLISLVRRTQPTLVAHELMGVQPMSGPTGLIFAMKTHITKADGTSLVDVWKRENGTQGQVDPTISGTHTTAQGEALGTGQTVDATSVSTTAPVTQTNPWAQMSFTIDKTSVTAVTRAMKANYTTELAQDLRAIHGLDAETELSNLLSGEIAAEINREVVSTLFGNAIVSMQTAGATPYDSLNAASATGQSDASYRFTPWAVATSGVFDMAIDADGRWEAEKVRGLIGVINRVAQEIALGTRRGLGNIIITSPSVAGALDMVATLDTSLKNVGNLSNPDLVGVTFAGVLLGRYKVFVDPYLTADDVLVGYKGSNAYDAGYYYCPYVPLSFMKTTHEESFQPVIGFKTRYGMATNPLTTTVAGTLAGANPYFRKFTVTNLGLK